MNDHGITFLMNKPNAIIIPIYNPDHFHYENIKRYRELSFDGFDIIVVDNHSDKCEYLDLIKELDFVTYELNSLGKTYEAGALLHVYLNKKYATYFLIQDSVEVYNFQFIKNYSNFYANYILILKEFFPALSCFDQSLQERQFFDERFGYLAYLLDNTPGFFGCNFACKKHHLDALVLSNILSKENLPYDKAGSMAWERIFSVGFRHLKFSCNFLLSRKNSFVCPYYRKHFFNRQ